MAARKSHLQVVQGGKKTAKKSVEKLAVNRPLIGIVPAAQITAKKGLVASDYLNEPVDETLSEKKYRGRSRVYPEINVLTAAKRWHLSLLRHAKKHGYSTLSQYFKSETVLDADKKLADAVTALVAWERDL